MRPPGGRWHPAPGRSPLRTATALRRRTRWTEGSRDDQPARPGIRTWTPLSDAGLPGRHSTLDTADPAKGSAFGELVLSELAGRDTLIRFSKGHGMIDRRRFFKRA